MSAAPSSPSTTSPETAAARPVGRSARVIAFVVTIILIIAVSVLPLLTPWFVHAGLDASDSSARLGVSPEVAHELSDRSVGELLLGPGDFAFAGPDGGAFYDESERAHLRDARLLLWLTLAAGAFGAAAMAIMSGRSAGAARAAIWRASSRAGAVTAIGVIVLGLASIVAFGPLFTLFHQVFFPGGNFTFDPATQRLVQLYPYGFWQVAAGALGVVVFVVAIAAWLIGRSIARRTLEATDGAHAHPAVSGSHG